MKIKLTTEEHGALPEEEQALYLQPEGEEFFVHKDAHAYGEARAEKVHKTVKALREELKKAAKPEDVSRLQQEIALRDAIESVGGNRYARAFFADRVSTDEDGGFVLKGENGKILRDDAEQPLTLTDALKSIKDSGEHGTLFNARSSGSTGGGAPRASQSTPEPRRAAMTEDERRKFLSEQVANGKSMREAIRALEKVA